MTRELNLDRRGFRAAAAIAGLELTMLGSTATLLHGPLSALKRATT